MISLYERVQVHRARLAEIQAGREVDAAPIAEEVERLEAEEAEASEAIARTVQAQVAADDTIADLRASVAEMQAELELLAGVREAAHDQAIEQAQRRGRVADALVKARGRFDAAKSPTHARHVQRRIRHIEDQIRTIHGRYPEARGWRVEMLISQELVATGIEERAGKTAEAFRSKAFEDKFRERFQAATADEREDLVGLAAAVLADMGVDAADVLVRAQVRRDGKVRWLVGGATGEARARALGAIVARQQIQRAAAVAGEGARPGA